MRDPEFRLGILGPFEVWHGDRAVIVSSPKHRALLAMLALDAGRTVPTSQLTRGVWGGDQPENPRRAVQVLVTRLRSLLAPGELISTRPNGYALEVAPERVDVGRFRYWLQEAGHAAERGDLDREACALAEALAQWRGEPLADVPSEVLQREAAPLLCEQRLQALERRFEVDLRRGRHHEVVAELSGISAEHPLRERIWVQLMAALSAAGRRADALTAYHTVRRRLAEELGIDPGEELRRQYATILAGRSTRGDDATVLPVPRQLPAEVPGFAGRVEELRRLDELLAGTDQKAVIVVVAGMAGVGKTALAARWARRVADRFPDGQLWTNLRGYEPDGAMPAEQVLTRFLRALGVPRPKVPLDLEEQAGLYRSLMDGRRMLVVLDNAGSAEQVRPMLPGGAGSLVLVTSRNQLMSLVAAEGAHPLLLSPLTTEDSRRMLTQRLGPQRISASLEATSQIIDGCARLPLALAIVAARAAGHSDVSLDRLAAELAGTTHGLSPFAIGDPSVDVRDVFSLSYQALGAEAARLFRLLSLHPGPDFNVAAVASLAGIARSSAQRLMAELTGAHLLTEPVPGRYALHDLLRSYAAERADAVDNEADRHAARHRMLDHYLHTAHVAADLLRPGSHTDPVRPPAAQPGVTPEALDRYPGSVKWWAAEHQVVQGCVQLAASTGFYTHAWQLACTLSGYLDQQGYWHDAATVQQVALAAALRSNDRLGQAHTHRQLAVAQVSLGEYEDAHRHLRRALAGFGELGNVVGQAMTLMNLGTVSGRQGRHRVALGHSEQALELYRAAGHRAGQAHALNGAGWYRAQLGDYPRALADCRQALALFQEIGDQRGQAGAWDSLGFIRHGWGQYPQALGCYLEALRLYRLLGERYYAADTLVHIGDTQQAAGDLAAAREAWQQALDLLEALDDRYAKRVRGKLDELGA